MRRPWRQAAAWEQWVARAVAAPETWQERKRGKKRWGAAALQAAAEPIVARHGVVGPDAVQVSPVGTEVSRRPYKDRPAVVEVREEGRVVVGMKSLARRT